MLSASPDFVPMLACDRGWRIARAKHAGIPEINPVLGPILPHGPALASPRYI